MGKTWGSLRCFRRQEDRINECLIYLRPLVTGRYKVFMWRASVKQMNDNAFRFCGLNRRQEIAIARDQRGICNLMFGRKEN